MAEKTILSALSRAIAYTPPNLMHTNGEILNMKKRVGDAEFAELCQRVEFGIREATCEFPNFGAIVEQLMEVGTDMEKLREACHLRVGIPLKPMLAKPTKGVGIILKRFEDIRFTCEYKYDGFRGQIHLFRKEGHDLPIVTIYSRNLENMTPAYPDVVQFLQGNVRSDVTDYILDAELVAYDKVNDKILPFQLLT